MTQRWQDAVEQRAGERLPGHVFAYLRAGSFDQVSAGEAAAAWSRHRLAPMVLRDVRTVDTGVSLLGRRFETPVGVAPTSMQRLVHPDGELAMAQAAAEHGRPLVVSSNAGTAFAEIGATGADWWLQAYLTADRALVDPMLARAVAAGAGAVVLTVDTPQPGPKQGVDASALGADPAVYGLNHPEAVRGSSPGAAHAADLRPADIARLAERTGLPVVVKGVLRGDDAEACLEAGAAAIWVSNHGGRQLDRAITTASALLDVVAAVGGRGEVYVDGGLSSGLDVLTALSLGADACFLGRLPLYALVDGQLGVARCLGTIDTELRTGMRLAGASTVHDTRDLRPLDRSNRL